MRFLPKTTCEKLVKMGCVSKSEFYFWLDPLNDTYKPVPGVPFFSREEIPFKVPAFTLEDFVSTDEYAIDNCRKLWGRELICERCNQRHGIDAYDCGEKPTMNMLFFGAKDYSVPMWSFKRSKIISLSTKDWVEFISEAVEERSKTL